MRHTLLTRPVVAAVTAALLATSLPAVPAFAAGKAPAVSASSVDLSARRRHHRGNTAAASIFAGAVGTIIGLAAANVARRDDPYRYGYGYGYDGYQYGPPPPPYGYYHRPW